MKYKIGDVLLFNIKNLDYFAKMYKRFPSNRFVLDGVEYFQDKITGVDYSNQSKDFLYSFETYKYLLAEKALDTQYNVIKKPSKLQMFLLSDLNKKDAISL